MEIEYIAIHCSATPPSMDIGVPEISRWHRERGFRTIGYHVVIRRDGTVEYGRNFGMIGAHVKGYNSKSLGVCLVGGVDSDMEAEDNFTDEQFSSLDRVLTALQGLFPDAVIQGHRDFPNVHKACPSFNVKEWLDQIIEDDYEY